MPKRTALTFTLLALIACFLSYKLGSSPVAHAQSLPPAPATWQVSGGGLGGIAVASKAAGGSGVQHVATCVSMVVATSSSATGQATEDVTLRDGAQNSGTVLQSWQFFVSPGSSSSVSLCGLNIVGSANTAMTLQDNNSNSNWSVTLNLVGYDAQ